MNTHTPILQYKQSIRQRTKVPHFNCIGGDIRVGRTCASGSNGEGCKQSFNFCRLADLLSMIGFKRLWGSLSTWQIGYISEQSHFSNVIRAGQEDGGRLLRVQDDFGQRSPKLPMPDTKFGELYMGMMFQLYVECTIWVGRPCKMPKGFVTHVY